MTTTKEELLASTIRRQITYLEGLLKEMDEEPHKSKSVLDRIRDVEKKLHELRASITF